MVLLCLSFIHSLLCARHREALFVCGAGVCWGRLLRQPPHRRPSLIMMSVSPREVEDVSRACVASVLSLPRVPKLVNEFLFCRSLCRVRVA